MYFSSKYFTSSSNNKVGIPDGSLFTIAGIGTIPCSSFIILSSVLHIPKVSHNLLSISSLTNDLNCSLTIFPNHCIFEELGTGKMIGSGKLQGGLYYSETKALRKPSLTSYTWNQL